MSKAYDWFDENIGFGGLFVIAIALSLVGVIVAMFIASISGIAEDNKHVAYLRTKIGDKYIIHRDTLMILEFDEMEHKYLLSNGFYVAPEVIYKSKKVK